MRYCQNAFGCLPVADIVKKRTCKFLQKFDVAANVIYQACIPDVDILFTFVTVYLSVFSHFLIVYQFVVK